MVDVLLADIGNSNFHIYDGKTVAHLTYDEAMKKYANQEMYYICVNHELGADIEAVKSWKDIVSYIDIEGSYETMGIDRKALCLSHKNGIFVDAGSAITVDVVLEGKYMGGFILPGIQAYLKSYASISESLDIELCYGLELTQLPATTKEQISYGIIASIKALIDKHRDDLKLYFTGGDGKFLSQYFDEATYDEVLVFNGMRQALKDKYIC